MTHRKFAIANNNFVLVEQIINNHIITVENLEEETIEEYKKLNKACDKVLEKIKNRKSKK